MSFNWDISIYNRDNQLVLVAEVKAILNASQDWGAKLRRNLLAHGILPNAPYFLLAFPDKLYLWTNSNTQMGEIEPTYAIDANPIFQPYFQKARVPAEKISGQSFELIVTSWLREIINSKKLLNELDESQHWLIESGLYTAISGGKLASEDVA